MDEEDIQNILPMPSFLSILHGPSTSNKVYYIQYTADIPVYNQYLGEATLMTDSLEIHLTGVNQTESEETTIFDILDSLESGIV